MHGYGILIPTGQIIVSPVIQSLRKTRRQKPECRTQNAARRARFWFLVYTATPQPRDLATATYRPTALLLAAADTDTFATALSRLPHGLVIRTQNCVEPVMAGV